MRSRSSVAALVSTLTRTCENRRAPSPPETAVDPSSVCRLARDSWGRGTVPEPARHAESGGADAGGQRDIAGDARICRACNLATLGRGNPAEDLIGRTL